MKPFQGCYYLGAYRAFSSIKDGFLLIHSVSGCNWGALALSQMGRQDAIHQGTTMMHENEIVFGGEGKLAEALAILKRHSPKRVYVLNGCPTDMIHDDVQSVIDEADCPFPVHWMNTAGYKGSMRQGYIDAMCCLAGMLPRCESAGDRSVNLIGISSDDYRGEADVESIRRMLAPEVRVNALLPMLTEDSMKTFGQAALNVVFRGFEAVGEALKESLDMDYVVVDYPYGASGSEAFLKKIDECLGCDHRDRIAAGNRSAEGMAKQVLHPLRMIYQAETAVAGDHARAEALRRFLADEMGFRVTAYLDDLNPSADNTDWMEHVQNSGVCIAFGSSFERQVEDMAPVKLVRFAYPVMDSVALGYQPYAGYDGLPILLSDILNALMTVSYRRNGRFNP